MTKGNSNSGSSKITGYGTIAAVVVGLLTAVFTFGAEVMDRFGSDDPQPANSSTAYSDYETITSEDGALSVEIPSKWADVRTVESWHPYKGGKSYTEDGAGVAASTSLTLYYGKRQEVPGFYLGASAHPGILARDDIDLLESSDSYFSELCSFRDEHDELDNGPYAMERDVWTGCGPKEAELWNVVATPEDRAYVAILEITVISEADREAADRILNTFKVDEDRLSPQP